MNTSTITAARSPRTNSNRMVRRFPTSTRSSCASSREQSISLRNCSTGRGCRAAMSRNSSFVIFSVRLSGVIAMCGMLSPLTTQAQRMVRRQTHDVTNFPQTGHHWRLLWLIVQVPQWVQVIECGSCGRMFFHPENSVMLSSLFCGIKLEMGSIASPANATP